MRTFELRSFVLSSLVALVAACAGSSAKPTDTPKQATNDPSCPVAVAGTSVTVEDADNGAALVFVTTGDVAEVRRRVAAMAKMHNDHHASMSALPDGKDTGGHAGHDMGNMGNMGSGHDMGNMGSGHDMGNMGSGSGHDMSGHDMSGHDMSGHDMNGHDMSGHDMSGHAGMIGIHSKATASDIDGGAKLLFVSAPGDVAKLQSELRAHAQHLATGSCGMGKS